MNYQNYTLRGNIIQLKVFLMSLAIKTKILNFTTKNENYFHPLALSETEAIITVGEMHPQMNFAGDTLLAHLSSE